MAKEEGLRFAPLHNSHASDKVSNGVVGLNSRVSASSIDMMVIVIEKSLSLGVHNAEKRKKKVKKQNERARSANCVEKIVSASVSAISVPTK